MARRRGPNRLHEAHRAGHLSRLMAEGKLDRESADLWLRAWDVEATRRGLDRHGQDY